MKGLEALMFTLKDMVLKSVALDVSVGNESTTMEIIEGKESQEICLDTPSSIALAVQILKKACQNQKDVEAISNMVLEGIEVA
jgi:hypothetical protein